MIEIEPIKATIFAPVQPHRLERRVSGMPERCALRLITTPAPQESALMGSKYTGCCIALLCRTVYHPPTAPGGPRCWLDCAYLAEHCCRECSCVSSCTKALAWYLHCEETTVETLSWRRHWSGQSRWMPDRAAAAVCLMELRLRGRPETNGSERWKVLRPSYCW